MIVISKNQLFKLNAQHNFTHLYLKYGMINSCLNTVNVTMYFIFRLLKFIGFHKNTFVFSTYELNIYYKNIYIRQYFKIR